MSQSTLQFSEPDVVPSSNFDEPMIWIRRMVFVEGVDPPVKVIRHLSFRRGVNIIATEARTDADNGPVGHSVGKSLLVRIIRYCLGEERYCTDSQRMAIVRQFERSYALCVLRVNGEDWAVARPLGLESGYRDSWCKRTTSLKDLLKVDGRLKYREFVDALELATKDCFADIDLPNAARHATWTDLLGWLSRDQDCYFSHHAEWRVTESQAGPRVLTKTDANLVIRMAMGLLGPLEIGLIAKHRCLQIAHNEAETSVKNQLTFVTKTEDSLRNAVTELKDQPTGEIFGTAFTNIATKKISGLNDLLEDPTVIKKDVVKALQDALEEALRVEGQCKTKHEEWATKKEATQVELTTVESQKAPDLLASMSLLLWRCRYFTTEEQAKTAGCPGQQKMSDPKIVDPWRRQRIAGLKDELAAVDRQCESAQLAYSTAVAETSSRRTAVEAGQKALDDIRGGIGRQIGQWEAKVQQAEQYAAAWESLNDLVKGREKRERSIAASADVMRKAREKFEKEKGQLSSYYSYVLKNIISSAADGDIAVTGDGIWPRSNSAVADSGTTLRHYANVLGFDLSCLVASVAGVGHLPRLWIHDSPRQADSEEQLFHSTLILMADLETKYPVNRQPSFQYILATTSAAPPSLNHSPYVRLRLHGRTGKGKLLKREFGK